MFTKPDLNKLNRPLSCFCHTGFKTRLAVLHFQDGTLPLLCATLQQQQAQEKWKELRCFNFQTEKEMQLPFCIATDAQLASF